MEEVNLTEFREKIAKYYDFAVTLKTPVLITNRKNSKGDAVLISREEYDAMQSLKRFAAYHERLALLEKRIERLEENDNEKESENN
ncbi:MAG: type II toxin-antitoxin system Phd/YefM family antitoxin [Saccharofermentans sp.]|nr:type II toxin-antitoxin system Phd/YefM family antitoxin [Saccharofermentans sp.]